MALEAYIKGKASQTGLSIRYNPSIVTNNLILCLDAADIASYPTNGNTWYDLTRYHNNGTFISGPTFNAEKGGNITFDGTNDFVDCGDVDSIGLTNFTVESWAKASGNSSNQGVIGISQLFNLYYNNTATEINWWAREEGIGSTQQVSATNLTVGEWYHFVGTVQSNNSIKLYVNGSEIDSASIAWSTNTGSTNLTIGDSYPSAGSYLSGHVAKVNIYNRALSSSEILRNYTTIKNRFDLVGGDLLRGGVGGYDIYDGGSLGVSGAYDDFDSYTLSANLNNLDGGYSLLDQNFSWNGAWVYTNQYVPDIYGYDDFDSYSTSTNLNNQSAGTGWSGAWVVS